MAEATYERLSAMDSSFLVFEGPSTHMHVGGTAIFEGGPLTAASGGVDIDRVRRHIASRLHLIPRYRQRLAFVPLEDRAVWIDDDHFNLDYHVRHTSLPRPGDERQLKRLTGRIMSQQLDRRRPLWEAWIVEGLDGGRVGLISKVHHCMVDGVAGFNLLAALLTTAPDETIDEAPPWVPQPAPSGLELLTSEILRRAQLPFVLGDQLRKAWQAPEAAAGRLRENISALWQLASTGLRLPEETPLNRRGGPHRHLDWLTLQLAEVKEVKNHLGGTLNDVVLATVAGAVRRFFLRLDVDVEHLEYRAAVPVSTRLPSELGAMGNRVSAWLTPLPIQEGDALRRYSQVRDTTARLKESKQARGAGLIEGIADWVGPGLLGLGVRLASWVQPYHVIVSNVPGPQMPLYMLGARVQVGYPVVPLFENQGLGVAVFSYDGRLCWGINADWETVPNVHEFVEDVRASFAELQEAARRQAGRHAPARRRQGAAKNRRLAPVALIQTEPETTDRVDAAARSSSPAPVDDTIAPLRISGRRSV